MASSCARVTRARAASRAARRSALEEAAAAAAAAALAASASTAAAAEGERDPAMGVVAARGIPARGRSQEGTLGQRNERRAMNPYS